MAYKKIMLGFFAWILFFSTAGWGQRDQKWYLNYIKGRDFVADRKYEAAIEYLEYAIAQKGKSEHSTKFYGVMRDSYIPYYFLGVAYFNLGRYELARNNFEKETKMFGAIAGLPEKAELDRYLAEIGDRLAQVPTSGPAPNPTDAAEVKEYQSAYDLFTQGRLADARPLLEKIRAGKGQYAAEADQLLQKISAASSLEQELAGLARQADESFQRGEWDKALKIYQDISKRKPDYPGLLENMERCRGSIRLAAQLEKARQMAASDPARAEEILLEIGRENASFPGLDKVARLASEEKRRRESANRSAALAGYVRDGERAMQEGNIEKARRCFQDALNLTPGPDVEAQIRGNLAQIQIRLDKFQQVAALLARGKQAIQAKQRETARQIYTEVRALDPGNAEAATWLNILQNTDLGGGGELYQQLLRTGLRQFLVGDYAEAVSSLKNYLTFSKEKESLARFLLGAAQVSQSCLDRYRSPELLDEGRKNLRQVRQLGNFQLPDRLKTLISPRVLEIFSQD